MSKKTNQGSEKTLGDLLMEYDTGQSSKVPVSDFRVEDFVNQSTKVSSLQSQYTSPNIELDKEGVFRNMWNSFMNSIDEIDKSRYEGDRNDILEKIYTIQEEMESKGNDISLEDLSQYNSQLKKLQEELNEADENIQAQVEDIETSPVESQYLEKQAKRLDEEYTNVIDYVTYELPKDFGGTASEWGTQAALLAKDYAKGRFKSMIAKNAMKSIASEAIPGLGTAAHGMVTAALTLGDIAVDFFTLYKMREHETQSESAEAFNERLNQVLIQNGLDRNQYENLDPSYKRKLWLEAREGLNEFKQRQMSLMTGDFIDRLLLVTPWSKMAGRLTSYNKYTRPISSLTGLGLGYATEAGEEAAQYSFAKDYVAGKYVDNPDQFNTWWDSQKELFKGASYAVGLSDHRFQDDKDFRNAVRSGGILGGGMTSVGTIKNIKDDVVDYQNLKRDLNTTGGILFDEEQSQFKKARFHKALVEGKAPQFLESLREMRDVAAKSDTFDEEQVIKVEKEFKQAREDYNRLRNKIALNKGADIADEVMKEIFIPFMSIKEAHKAASKAAEQSELKAASILTENGVTDNSITIINHKINGVRAVIDKINNLEKVDEIPSNQKIKLKSLNNYIKDLEKLKSDLDPTLETEDQVSDFINLEAEYGRHYDAKAAKDYYYKELEKFNTSKDILKLSNKIKGLKEEAKEAEKQRVKKEVKNSVGNAESVEEVESIVNKGQSKLEDDSDKQELTNDVEEFLNNKIDEEPNSKLSESVKLNEVKSLLSSIVPDIDTYNNLESIELLALDNKEVQSILNEYYKKEEERKEDKEKQTYQPKDNSTQPDSEENKAQKLSIIRESKEETNSLSEDKRVVNKIDQPSISGHITAQALFNEEAIKGKGTVLTPASKVSQIIWDSTANEYIASGKLKSGDEVFYEYDTRNNYNNKSNYDKNLLSVSVVKYEGDRRIVVGLLKDNDSTLDIKQAIKERLGEFPDRKTYFKFDDLKTEVEEIHMNSNAVKHYTTDEFRNIDEVLREDQPRIFAVATEGANGESVLSIPSEVMEANKIVKVPFTETANKGFIYMAVQKPDGTWFPSKLFTKKLNQVPELENRVKEILEESINNGITGSPIELIDKLPTEFYDILPLQYNGKPHKNYKFAINPDGTIKLLKGINGKVEEAVYATPEEFIKGESNKLLLQIDKNRVDDIEYQKEILRRADTNLNPKVHFTGVSVKLKPISSASKLVLKDKEEEVKPKRKSRTSITRTFSPKPFKFNYERWDRKKELDWFNKRYKNVPVNVYEDLSRVSELGAQSWGLFIDGVISLSNNAAKGTLYHEAFHAIFNTYLSKKEQAKILKEANDIYASRYKGEKVLEEMNVIIDNQYNQYGIDITEAQAKMIWLEEQMAEDFRMIVESEEDSNISFPKAIANFFNNIRIIIKRMVGYGLTVDEMFFASARGSINNPLTTFRNVDSIKSTRTRLANFGVLELKDTVRFINNSVINEIFPDIYPNQNIQDVVKDTDDLGDFFKTLYSELIIDLEISKEDVEDGETKDFINKILSDMGTYQLTRDKDGDIYSIDNFIPGALIPELLSGLKVYGIKTGLKVNSDKQGILEDTELQEEDSYTDSWVLSEATISSREKITPELKAFLSSIPVVSPTTRELVKRGGKVLFNDGGVFFNKLIAELNGTYDIEVFKAKLKDMGKYEPSADAIFNVLVNGVDNFKGIGIYVKDKEALLTQLYQRVGAVSKKNPIVVRLDNTYDNKEQRWKRISRTFSSTRNGAERILLDNWKTNNKFAPYKNQDTLDSEYISTMKEDYNESKSIIQEGLIKQFPSTKISDGLDLLHNLLVDLGLNIKQPDIVKLYDSGKINELFTPNKSLDLIINNLSKGNDVFQQVEDTNSSARLELANTFKKVIPEISQLSYFSEGKSKYAINNPNFLSKLISNLTSPYTREGMKDFYMSYDTWFKNSPLLNEVLNNPKKAKNLEYSVFDTLTLTNGEQVPYTKLNKAQFMSMELNAFLAGGFTRKQAYYTTTIPADAPQLPMVKYVKESNQKIIENLYQVYKQETARIKFVKENKSNIVEEDIVKNYFDKGDQFHFFPNISETNLSLSEFTIKITYLLNKEYNSYIERLESEGVIVSKKDDKGKEIYNNLGEKEYVVTIGSKFLPTDLAVNNVVRNFIYNDYYMQTQIVTLTGVDPAFYKSKVDFYKRAKQTYSPGTYLSGEKVRTTYNTVYLKDMEIESEYKEAYKNNLIKAGFDPVLANNIAEQYNNVNVTDAQAFISLDRYEEIMVGAGKMTEQLKKSIDNIRQGKAIPEEYRRVLQPIKPFYFGHTEVNLKTKDGKVFSKIIPVQNKNSEAVLLPEFAKGNPDLERIINLFNNGVDSVQFESAIKVGLSGVATEEDINNGSYKIHKLYNSEYRIQQETPEHHIDTAQLFGTQLRRLIVADMEGNDYKYGGKYTADELVRIYSDLLSKLVKESYDKIKGRFSEDKIRQTLKEEITSRELGEQYLEGAEKLPLYDPLHVKRLESILSSIFRNNVTKQKTNGGSLINTTSYGLKDDLKIVFNEGGGIEYMEAIMPSWSKDFINEEGYVDIDKIDPELLEALFYRIPNEDKYSMFNIKVKEFLPEHAGGMIYLPYDVTQIAGLDFDIDKLYGIVYEHEFKNGRFVKADTVNNKILDLMLIVLKDPKSLESKINPGGFDKLSNIRDRVSGKKEDREDSVVSTAHKNYVYENNMAGRDLVGIAANHNSSHAVLQHYDINLPIELSIDGDKYISLSNIKNKEGVRISKEVASTLAAVLDNAKDPIAGDINLNTFTADLYFFLIRLGVPMENAVKYINSNVVKEITKDYFKGGANYNAYISSPLFKANEVDVQEIADRVNSGTFELGNINTSSTKIDPQTLESFVALKTLSESLGDLVRAMRVEKGSSSSLAHNEEYTDLVDKITSDKFPLTNVTEMYSNTAKLNWLGTMYEYGIEKANTDIGKFIPWFEDGVMNFKEAIKEQSFRPLRADEINLINMEVLDYHHSGLGNLKIGREDKAKFLNDVVNRVLNYKKSPSDEYLPLFDILHVQELLNNKEVKFVINAKKFGKSNEEIDDIRYIWEDMAYNGNEEEKNLAKDLVKYSYYTGGFGFKPNTLSSLIPVELKLPYILEEGSLSKTPSVESTERFKDQFIRNHYQSLSYIKNFSKEDLDENVLKAEGTYISPAIKYSGDYLTITDKTGVKTLFKNNGSNGFDKIEGLGTDFITEYDSSVDNLLSLFNETTEVVDVQLPSKLPSKRTNEEVQEFYNSLNKEKLESKSIDFDTIKSVLEKADRGLIKGHNSSESVMEYLKECYG